MASGQVYDEIPFGMNPKFMAEGTAMRKMKKTIRNNPERHLK